MVTLNSSYEGDHWIRPEANPRVSLNVNSGYTWKGWPVLPNTPVNNAYCEDSLGVSVLNSNLPIALPGASVQGSVVTYQFWDCFYNRIHVFPTQFDFGVLTTNINDTFIVWNAYFVPQALTNVVTVNGDGIVLTEPRPAPTTVQALELLIYQITVEGEGPGQVNATITFGFPAESPVITLTGTRASVFSLPPNWRDGLLERLEWLTDIIKPRLGDEQAIKLRSVPRRRFRIDHVLTPNRQQITDAFMWGLQGKQFVIPIWPDMQRLTAALPANSLSIPVDTTLYDFEDGGRALLIDDTAVVEDDPNTGLQVYARQSRYAEVVTIDTVNANSLDLEFVTVNPFPERAIIVPAALARMATSQEVGRVTSSIGVISIDWLVVHASTVPPEVPATLYQGLPVYERQTLWGGGLNTTNSRDVVRIDNRVGPITQFDPSGLPNIDRGFRWVLQDRAERYAFRRWLSLQSGRWGRFWLSTELNDMSLLTQITAIQVDMDIIDIEYRQHYQQAIGRRDIRIKLRDGTIFYRRIIGAALASNGVERVTIDSALGQIVDPGDVEKISFMGVNRMSADAIELLHHSVERSSAGANMRLIKA